jgi:hypothetical protein
VLSRTNKHAIGHTRPLGTKMTSKPNSASRCFRPFSALRLAQRLIIDSDNRELAGAATSGTDTIIMRTTRRNRPGSAEAAASSERLLKQYRCTTRQPSLKNLIRISCALSGKSAACSIPA